MPLGYTGFYNMYNAPSAYLGGPGNITPSTAAAYSPTAGGVPQVPDPLATTRETISGNLANLGGLESLGGAINPFQQQQLLGQYAAAIPNYAGITAAQSAGISSDLAGQVPQDVINLLQQQGAERGIQTGMPGSDNANAAYLRALGLTSLGLRSQGQQEANALRAGAPIAPPFDISRFMTTPQDVYSARQLANLYAAAPSPAAAEFAAQQAFLRGQGQGYGQPQGYAQPPTLPGGTGYTPIPRGAGQFAGAGTTDIPINWSDVGPPEYGPPDSSYSPEENAAYSNFLFGEDIPADTGQYADYTDPGAMMGYQDYYSDYGG